MGKALYRKYRPVRLEDVVGQKQVTDILSASLRQGKLSHAYLFIGPRGTGKTSVARIFAHEANGFAYSIEDDYVDIIEIDGASNRGVENIRDLKERVNIAPTSGKYKIYIIDEVHMLTKEAFNALLKTLEEPPEHVIFIMATTDAHKVPITITSRSQTYIFQLADFKTMFDFLKSVAEKEKIKIDEAALKIITERGEGSFRDSLSLLDQISNLSEDTISKEMVVKALGIPDDATTKLLLEAYQDGRDSVILAELRKILKSGLKPEILVEEMVRAIVAEPRAELMVLLSKLTEIKAPFIEAKILVALCKGNEVPQNINSVPRQKPLEKTNEAPKKLPNPPIASGKNTSFSPDDSGKIDNPLRENVDRTSQNDALLQQNSTDKPSLADSPQRAGGADSVGFSWDIFLQAVQAQSNGTYTHLVKCRYELKEDTLHIYPGSSFAQTLFNKKDRKDTLLAAAPGVKITIHEYGSSSMDAKNDETLAKISDIMGGEVKNDGGNNPFN